MKVRCLLGHDWRPLPWFKPLDGDLVTNPKKICRRCFKEWRVRYFLVVPGRAEGRGWQYYLPPHWEGQTPPEGYDSWKSYHEDKTERAVRELTKRRPELKVPRRRRVTPKPRPMLENADRECGWLGCGDNRCGPFCAGLSRVEWLEGMIERYKP